MATSQVEARASRTGILIIGAGLAGLTLSLALAKTGVKTTVVEKQKSITPSRWAILLYPMGMKIFDELGVLEDMTKMGIPLKAPELETAGGEVLAVVETGLLSEPRLNYSLLLGPSEIRKVLRERAIAQGVELFEGVTFKGVSRDSATGRISGALLDNEGEEVRVSSSVLVGADGYRSRVREEFGSKTKERTYPAIAGFFMDYEHGLDRMKMILGDGSQMVVLPCTRTRMSLGYTEQGLGLERLSREDGLTYVKQRMIESAPFLTRAIEKGIHSGDERNFFIEPKAIHVGSWVVDGGVLIGDAAHAFHPGSGMGAQQAFIDAVVLAPLLAECANRNDFSLQSLRRFEEQRRPFMSLLEGFNNRNISMQLSRGRFGIWLRNRSFRAIGKLMVRKEYQEIMTGVRAPTRAETLRIMAAVFIH